MEGVPPPAMSVPIEKADFADRCVCPACIRADAREPRPVCQLRLFEELRDERL